MKSTAEIGMKITARTREYYRYTSVSAELARRRLFAAGTCLGAASETAGTPRRIRR